MENAKRSEARATSLLEARNMETREAQKQRFPPMVCTDANGTSQLLFANEDWTIPVREMAPPVPAEKETCCKKTVPAVEPVPVSEAETRLSTKESIELRREMAELRETVRGLCRKVQELEARMAPKAISFAQVATPPARTPTRVPATNGQPVGMRQAVQSQVAPSRLETRDERKEVGNDFQTVMNSRSARRAEFRAQAAPAVKVTQGATKGKKALTEEMFERMSMGLTAINRNIEVIAIDGLTKAPIGLVKQFLEKAGVKKADLKHVLWVGKSLEIMVPEDKMEEIKEGLNDRFPALKISPFGYCPIEAAKEKSEEGKRMELMALKEELSTIPGYKTWSRSHLEERVKALVAGLPKTAPTAEATSTAPQVTILKKVSNTNDQ